MALLRTEVTSMASDDLPRDASVNSVYHTIADGFFDPSVDYDNQAQQVLDCFTGKAAGYTDAIAYQRRLVTAKVYNMADPLPRPPRSTKSYVPTAGAVDTRDALGPGQVALVLSFYGARNLPRERGRIFVGPWTKAEMTSRPDAAHLDGVTKLGHALFDVGGENVAWVVHSVRNATSEPVTTIWCDNSWDTQRRRSLKATTRQTLKP